MNFFEHQARARRRTSLLMVYFSCAVLFTVAAVNLAVFLLARWLVDANLHLVREWLPSPASVGLSLLTLGIIVGTSLWRLWQLRDGGPALAALLGARRIDPASRDTDERRLINVVEEMSIASGIPVPQLFVMDDEPAINAFVAGYRPTAATLMVTQGTLKRLDRDELQGVIAHEFSHIFNADMRLNLRLMAVLTGILAIGKVGEFILRDGRRYTYVRAASSRNNQGAALLFFLAAGAALTVIGYVGLFFGRLIKAAISRQRELLADASSVQFTRNPAGIAHALIRIRNDTGALLNTPQAEDMSHMCFAPPLKIRLRNLLATHPELDQRLEAIGPQWPARARAMARAMTQSGDRAAAQPAAVADASSRDKSRDKGQAGFAATAPAVALPSVIEASVTETPVSEASPAAGRPARAQMDNQANTVGTVTPEHMGYARRILESVPAELLDTVHDLRGAEHLMYALVLSVSESDPADLLPSLTLPEADRARVASLVPSVQALGSRLRLPLLDIALPVLQQHEAPARQIIVRQLEALSRADKRITLFEFLLLHLLRRHLLANGNRDLPIRHRSLRTVGEPIRILLSAMVHASGQRGEQAEALYRAVGTVLLPPNSPLLAPAECSLTHLGPALDTLATLTPLLKAGLVDACADIVMADGRVQVMEAELLRTVCTLLDCPMPPLFPDATAA